MARQFYFVLGISRDTDAHQIKDVYRRLVKHYHAGPSKQSDTISSPGVRRKRSDKLVKQPNYHVEIESKPLLKSGRRSPLSIQKDPPHWPENKDSKRLFSELDEFFEGWIPGIYSSGKGASRQKDLFVELLLTPAEAHSGGMIPLRVPVERTCLTCHGTGLSGLLSCQTCHGDTGVVEYDSIEISIPPGVIDGTVVKLPLQDIGLPNADLNVLVTVQ
jgi:molecular chaperone DnaJ